jgi:hypothetical protein
VFVCVFSEMGFVKKRTRFPLLLVHNLPVPRTPVALLPIIRGSFGVQS